MYVEIQLIANCVDLFSAGAESTSNTVAFACLYMILYPGVQAKIHKEIDAVIGKDGEATYRNLEELAN